jgi:DNA mismatch repair protein MutS2
MGFKIKDEVLVVKLKRPGTVVEVMKSGQFRVAVGHLLLVCDAQGLQPLDKKLKKAYAKYKAPPRHHPALKPTRDSKALETLDLHGVRVKEALEMVEKRIDRAIIADLDRVEIVHGIGAGKLKEAIHKYLAAVSVVSHFKVDDVNPGVTWVYFE